MNRKWLISIALHKQGLLNIDNYPKKWDSCKYSFPFLSLIQIKCVILRLGQSIIEHDMAQLNCIKAVLAEKGIMSKWLAKTLQKDPATVSKWCNNHAQPDLYTLARIAEVLDVDIHRLICHTKEE